MNFLSSAALRVLPGAFVLNSGIGKIGMPAEASAGTQQFAASAIPALKQLPPEKFGTILGWTETGVGGAMLAPFVSNFVAGSALTAFSSGLLALYFADPDNRQEDGIRPSEQGTALAKDSWLLAIGVALVVSSFDSKKSKKAKKAKKAAKAKK